MIILETVKAAVESGYYGIPRDTTLEDLATDLNVSHQALSERLRRGHRALIESVIRCPVVGGRFLKTFV
jgi:predicted DNA binding protein